jgi:glycosyltransferase involved in cell wall biosynthesis
MDAPSPKPPRKVLIYAPYVGQGGARRLLLRLLTTWLETTDRNQWQFQVLSQTVDGSGEILPWPEGIFSPVLGNEIHDHLGGTLCDFLQSNQDRFFQSLRKHAEGVDVIWLPQPWWTLRLQQQIVDLPAHIVPTVHDFAFDELHWDGEFGDRFRAEARAFVQASSRLVFSANYTLQKAVERYGMQAEQGEVIYLADFVPDGFDPTEAEASRVRAAYQLPDTYWLAFHAIGHKDPLTIFEALAKSKALLGDRFCPLVIAGMGTERMRPDTQETDGYHEKVKQCIANSGLKYGVDYHVLGFLPDADIAGLYRGATGCISASRSEAGLNGSIFEAQRAKTPLIHSDIPQFMERLGDQGEFGLHFKCGDSEDLTRVMLQLLDDPDAAQRRAAAAHATFCGRTWEDVAGEYLKVFEHACLSGPATRVWAPPPPPPAPHAPHVSRLRTLRRRIKKKIRNWLGRT